MLAAVLSITNDGIDKTRMCFDKLQAQTGVEYHHYVLDMDSRDGTDTYLLHENEEGRIKFVHFAGMKVSWNNAINFLVEKAMRHGSYSSIVIMEPNCLMAGLTDLSDLANVAFDEFSIVSPIVGGEPLQVGPSAPVGRGKRVRLTGKVPSAMFATPETLWRSFRVPDDEGPGSIASYADLLRMMVGQVEGVRAELI